MHRKCYMIFFFPNKLRLEKIIGISIKPVTWLKTFKTAFHFNKCIWRKTDFFIAGKSSRDECHWQADSGSGWMAAAYFFLLPKQKLKTLSLLLFFNISESKGKYNFALSFHVWFRAIIFFFGIKPIIIKPPLKRRKCVIQIEGEVLYNADCVWWTKLAPIHNFSKAKFCWIHSFAGTKSHYSVKFGFINWT